MNEKIGNKIYAQSQVNCIYIKYQSKLGVTNSEFNLHQILFLKS